MTRIREYTIRQPLGSDTHYEIDLVVSPGEAAAGGGGGGAPTSCADNTPVLINPGTYSWATHGPSYAVGSAVTIPSTLDCTCTGYLRDFVFTTTDNSKSFHIRLFDVNTRELLAGSWGQLDINDGPFPTTLTYTTQAQFVRGRTVRFEVGTLAAIASEITWSVGPASGLFFS